jgi:hypothetical protein
VMAGRTAQSRGRSSYPTDGANGRYATVSKSMRDRLEDEGGQDAPWLEGRAPSGGSPIEACAILVVSSLLPPLTPGSRRLQCEILSFTRWIRPTCAEHDYRLYIFGGFQRIVQREWPGASCELFGSMATGLYLPQGCAVLFSPLCEVY